MQSLSSFGAPSAAVEEGRHDRAEWEVQKRGTLLLKRTLSVNHQYFEKSALTSASCVVPQFHTKAALILKEQAAFRHPALLL